MTSFFEIGIEYAVETESAEDAWEHVISNDQRVIEMLHDLNINERESAVSDFADGWVRGIQFPDSKDEVRLNAIYERNDFDSHLCEIDDCNNKPTEVLNGVYFCSQHINSALSMQRRWK